MSIDLNIGMSEIKVDPIEALIKGSKLNIKEFDENVDWDQQGYWFTKGSLLVIITSTFPDYNQ